MYEVNISLFYEGETREWDDFYVVGTFGTHVEADAFARALVTRCRHELEAMLGADPNGGGWDGLSVDIRMASDPPRPFDTSYELIPGRPIDVWHGSECHD